MAGAELGYLLPLHDVDGVSTGTALYDAVVPVFRGRKRGAQRQVASKRTRKLDCAGET